MEEFNITIEYGVATLIVAAHRRSPLNGERHWLRGDLNQMSKAYAVAKELGLTCDVEGGVPFVTSKADFSTLTQYLIDNKISGYHHYDNL